MSPYLSPLTVRLVPSLNLLLLVVLTYALTLVLVMVMEVETVAKSVLVAAVLLAAARSIHYCLHLATGAGWEATLHPDDIWTLQRHPMDPMTVALQTPVFVQPWLTILHFHGAGTGRVCFILTQDNIDRTAFRRLRVRLRHPVAAEPSLL